MHVKQPAAIYTFLVVFFKYLFVFGGFLGLFLLFFVEFFVFKNTHKHYKVVWLTTLNQAINCVVEESLTPQTNKFVKPVFCSSFHFFFKINNFYIIHLITTSLFPLTTNFSDYYFKFWTPPAGGGHSRKLKIWATPTPNIIT